MLATLHACFRWHWSFLAFFFLSLPASIAFSQYEYGDICAGFAENVNQFERSGVRVKWRNTRDYTTPPAVFRESYEAYGELLKDPRWQTDENKMLVKMIQGVYDLDERKRFNSPQSLAELFYCKTGSRLRICHDPKAMWEDGWPNFDWTSDVEMQVLTVINNDDFCASSITYFDIQGKCRRLHWVCPFGRRELQWPANISSPLTAKFGKTPSPLSDFFNALYHEAGSDSRNNAKISIRENPDDETLLLEIEDQPLNPFSGSKEFRYGWKVYAIIEPQKGFLPRVIKQTYLFGNDDRVFHQRADVAWDTITEFEIAELPDVGFYPKEITSRDFTWFPTKNDTPEILKNKSMAYYGEWGIERPKSQFLETQALHVSVESISKWSPLGPPDNELALKAPANAEEVVDMRDGEKRIRPSRLASLKDLDTTSEPKTEWNFTFLLLWAALAVLGFFLVNHARFKSKVKR